MNNRRRVMIALLIIGVPLFIWLQFFEVPSKVKLGQEKMQQDPETHMYEKVAKYASILKEDESSINHLLSELPFNHYKEAIEFNEEDETLLVNYDVFASEMGDKTMQAVIYNATATLALVDHLEQVELHFADETYTVSRDRVERWFGTTLVDLKDPEIFQEKVQEPLKSDVSSWFLAYVESE